MLTSCRTRSSSANDPLANDALRTLYLRREGFNGNIASKLLAPQEPSDFWLTLLEEGSQIDFEGAFEIFAQLDKVKAV